MSIFTDGYVTDIAYENSFYRDLTPNFLRPTLLLNGMDFPTRKEGEPFRYLELGFGAGTSLNVHAASMEGEFWGNDFNPNHVLEAEKIAREANLDVHILDDSFEQLERKSQQGLLPKFDMIALHGIWSWVSKKNRQYILNIIDNTLKSGGIVYLSYNTLPGWADFIPIRHLLTTHAQILGNETQNSSEKLQNALDFVKNFTDKNFKFITDHPTMEERIENLEMNNLSYLVHEYMNENWNAFYFKDVATDLASVRCSFLASSRLLNYLPISLPDNASEVINNTSDIVLRETLRDYAQNQQFRCDIFTKGQPIFATEEVKKSLNQLRFALTSPLSAISLQLKTIIGEITCDEDIYLPLLKAFQMDNYKPKTYDEIQNHTLCKHIPHQGIFNAFQIILGAGYIHATQIPSEKIQKQTIQLNNVLCNGAINTNYTKVLASSILGSAIAVSRLDLLIIHARLNNKTSYNDLILYILPTLKKLGGLQSPDGVMPDDDDIVKDLYKELETFASIRLPYYQAMGIIV